MSRDREIKILIYLDGLGRSQYTTYKAKAVRDLIATISPTQRKLHVNITMSTDTLDDFKFMVMCIDGGCAIRLVRDPDSALAKGNYYAQPVEPLGSRGFSVPFIPYQEPFDYEIFSFPKECVLSVDDALERIERYIDDRTMGDDVVIVPTDDISTGIVADGMIEESPYVIEIDALL